MEEKLRIKTQKCDSLSNRLIEIENDTSNFVHIQAQLREHVTTFFTVQVWLECKRIFVVIVTGNCIKGKRRKNRIYTRRTRREDCCYRKHENAERTRIAREK